MFDMGSSFDITEKKSSVMIFLIFRQYLLATHIMFFFAGFMLMLFVLMLFVLLLLAAATCGRVMLVLLGTALALTSIAARALLTLTVTAA
jgi:hypothetical protein